MFSTWLPQTKLNPPSISQAIARHALLAQLRLGVENHKLSLISSPAGSGKTTLLANLIEDDSLRYAWLSLDEFDNDAQTFITALISSVQVLDPEIGTNALALIQESPEINLIQIMGMLINDLIQQTESVLIFDDFHTIQNADILQAVDFLVARLPENIRLLIATRHDPTLSLAKLRTRRQLFELRLERLRFSGEETELLFNQELALALTEDDIATLYSRTNGWIAGLRLIGLSLANIDDAERSQHVQTIIGNNQFVFDLLADEVLNQQDETIRSFLLETSILDDLSPEICQAVSQNGDAQAILDSIYRRNLFLRIVDARTNTYRYHDLFKDFLSRQLEIEQAERIPALHKRAGDAHPITRRQIDHYLLAHAWNEAIDLMSEIALDMLDRGQHDIVREWLARIPQQVQDSNAWLVLFNASLAYHGGDFEIAMTLADQAESLFEEAGNSYGMVEAIFIHNSANQGDDDIESQMRYKAKLMPLITEDKHQLYLTLMMAWAYLSSGMPKEARSYIVEFLQLVKKAPDRLGSMGFHISGTMLLAFDDTHTLTVLLRSILQTHQFDNSVFGATAYGIFVHDALWRGDLPQARDYLEECKRRWDALGGTSSLHQETVHWQECLLDLMSSGITSRVQEIFNYAHQHTDGNRHILALDARECWFRGDMQAFQEIYQIIIASAGEDILRTHYGVVRALYYLAEGRFEELESEFIHQVHIQQTTDDYYNIYLFDMRLTLAFCYLHLGYEDAVLKTLKPVMQEYQANNMPGRIAQEYLLAKPLMQFALQHRLYPDFAQAVLDILQTQDDVQTITISETGETLTPREVEVLALLVDGASNQDIADTFFISIPTVKTHVSRILQKLQVQNRTQAAMKARELRLFI